jgi:hypothetical protein
MQIGETFSPSVPCGNNGVFLQTGSTPPGQYIVPSPGVLTSWSYQAAASAPQIKLKVGRPQGGAIFTIVGESDLKSPALNTVNVYPVRIAVASGDVIGIYTPTAGLCGANPPGYSGFAKLGDDPPGTTGTYSMTTGKLDLAAVLESDTDNDGFGDETQDECPGLAGPVNGCPEPTDTSSPQAQITKGPKDKTRKKRATFEFAGADARAVASFQCSLDGGAFATCTSPHTVKVKKGKHTFQVRAVDDVGNVGTAASDSWKVKKKKRR